jgi:uncharacterized damage-inducible protein DinB
MPESVDGLLHDLQASRERLLAVVAGVTEEQFKRRPPVESVPVAGDWSIAEVLAHLLAVEQRRCARLEALLRGESEPAPRLTDEERNTEARHGRTVPVPQIIHGLLAARRRLERALPAPEANDTIAALVREDVIAHEGEHRAQIEAVKAVLGAARPPRG